MKHAVCWKYVALGRPTSHADPTDDPAADPRWAGVSPADEAALQLALDFRDVLDGGRRDPNASTVTVVALGPAAADDALRSALAVGADRVVRVDAPTSTDGRAVARALAAAVADADLVWCGDYSLDRGTGSVPAFLAAELGAAQALGLVSIDAPESDRPIRAVRRLDGGRREVLEVRPPAVVSVEGSVASLRRASLSQTLAARTAQIDVVPGPDPTESTTATVTPYRPRARVLDAPAGSTLDRVRSILDVGGGEAPHAETVTLDPPAAAARILAELDEWGYLDNRR